MGKMLEEREELTKEQCSFSPTMKSKLRSQEILQSSKGSRIRCKDSHLHVEERDRKNIKRQKILRDIEKREATFSPYISRTSRKLQEKMTEERKLMRDPVTRQTIPTPNKRSTPFRKGGTGTNMDPGHEDEIFTPEISPRAREYSTNLRGDVFKRLFKEGVAKGKLKKREQAALLQTFHKDISLKTWEDEGKVSSTRKTTSVFSSFTLFLCYNLLLIIFGGLVDQCQDGEFGKVQQCSS